MVYDAGQFVWVGFCGALERVWGEFGVSCGRGSDRLEYVVDVVI